MSYRLMVSLFEVWQFHVVLKASEVRTRGWVINYCVTMAILYEMERLDQPTWGVVCLAKAASYIWSFPQRNMSIQHARQCNKSVMEQTVTMPRVICSFPCSARDNLGSVDACSAVFHGSRPTLFVALQQLDYHGNTPLQRLRQHVPPKRQLNDLVSESGFS